MTRPFRSSGTSANDNIWGSPTVYLEKGAYRIRAPPKKLFTEPASIHESRPRRTQSMTNGYLTVLVCLLASACLACFGSAYYLFTTRWENSMVPETRRRADYAVQVVECNDEIPPMSPKERFLAYLPHSGFHNQRIAFENALTLARLLNRTLIVPPIRLARRPLHYYKFDTLYRISGMSNFSHCALEEVILDDMFFPECNYDDFTYIQWDWLVNLTNVREDQRLVVRHNMSHEWLYDRLHIADSDIMTLRDHNVYQYRFLDTSTDASPAHHKFRQDVYISQLSTVKQPLLQLGTLFGSSRLRLKNPSNAAIRQKIRQSMTFTNPLFLEIVNSVKHHFAQDFVGAHVRLGDGPFRAKSAEIVREIWRGLVIPMLNKSVEDVNVLERMFWETEAPLRPTWKLPSRCELSEGCCRSPLHTLPSLAILNLPLFISTDVRDPDEHPDLEGFLRTFPCTYFLQDFRQDTGLLDKLKNGVDGWQLKKFVLPFIDAMVVGHADAFVGTSGSTYSGFIEDVLWPTYHGLEIKQRG